MKYLLICEGKSEEILLNILLDNNLLKINRDMIIGRVPYICKNFKKMNPVISQELKHYNKETYILKVGDTQKDKLTISKDLSNILSLDRINIYKTKPEIEILIIINEKQYVNYKKKKLSPKDYMKSYIKFNNKLFKGSAEELKEYYKDSKVLMQNINEYKRIKKQTNEKYLADLLN